MSQEGFRTTDDLPPVEDRVRATAQDEEFDPSLIREEDIVVEQGEQVAERWIQAIELPDYHETRAAFLALLERVRLLEQENGRLALEAATADQDWKQAEQREKGLREQYVSLIGRVEEVREQMSGPLREKLWEALAASPRRSADA